MFRQEAKSALMTEYHFIKLKRIIGNYLTKVSTEGCSKIADLIKSIKVYHCYEDNETITLFEPDGCTEIDPETPIDYLNELDIGAYSPLIVQLDLINPFITIEKPEDKFTSSRSFLKSIALELDKIYPIVREKSATGKERPVLFSTIVYNATHYNPDPYPEFKSKYGKLKDYFTLDEWNLLEALEQIVNVHFHFPLFYADPVMIQNIFFPLAFYKKKDVFKEVAKKLRIVDEACNLIVKSEECISEGKFKIEEKLRISHLKKCLLKNIDAL